MSANIGNSFIIPQFVSAPSPRALVRAMLRNNLRFGTQFKYFDIQKDGNRWIAWFMKEIDRETEIENVLTHKGKDFN